MYVELVLWKKQFMCPYLEEYNIYLYITMNGQRWLYERNNPSQFLGVNGKL